MKIYVEAKSKAALIRRLSAGEEISGYNYSMFGGGGHYMLDDTLDDGTIIAIYSQMSGGNPVAKSWGTWTNGVLKAESFNSEGKMTFEAYDPADAWDNHIHQEEMAEKAYEEYLEELEEDDEPLSFADWMTAQIELEAAYLEEQYKQMEEDSEEIARLMDDPEYTTLEGTLDAETFESPVSCKICGKTFDSFRGLNGHMNAHLPSHRKRAETFEAHACDCSNSYRYRFDRDLDAVNCDRCGGYLDAHKYKVPSAGVVKYAETFEAEPSIVRGTWMGGVVEFSNGDVFVKVITFPVTDDSGFGGESMWVILEEGNEFDGIGILDNDPVHSEIKSGSRIKFAGGTPDYKPHFVAVVEAETFEAELSEQLPYEIITTDWKSSIAPENRHNNDNWFITGDIIFAVPDSEGNYGRGEETIVRISTYGEGTTLDEAKEDGIFRATENLYDDYSRGYFTQNAETFEADYCNTCKIPDHDSCSLTEDCPCCDNTMAGIYRKRFGAEDELTIEEFFRDMETTLDKYGAWDWDSEAHDGVLGFSGNLTPTNGENFYQYDLDFDEIRQDETFEARGTSGWQVTCSKCGAKGHNKSTCGRPKPKTPKPRATKSKGYVRKTIDKDQARRRALIEVIVGIGAGIFIGRNL